MLYIAFVMPIALKVFVGAFISLLQSQDYQYPCYIHLIGDAVGQSLSTRPDIIGVEMSKVRLKTLSVLLFLVC